MERTMTNKWHKVAEDDLPKEGGNYWCKLKDKYIQGSSHYKQHCNNGYCILQWLPKKKVWNVRYNTEVEAWIELPKYDEQFETERQALIDKACEWLRNNMYEGTCEQILSKKSYPFMSDFIEEFKQAMKGGNNEQDIRTTKSK